MKGVSHKAIGIGLGVASVAYAVESGNLEAAMMMVTCPIGAMLPDIDHDNSALGAERKKFMDVMTTFLYSCLGISILSMLITKDYVNLILTIIPILMLMFIMNQRFFKNRIKFFVKHRGIMHTMIIPFALLNLSLAINVAFINYLLYGLAIGYMSHLFTDCLTIMGCPILWPFTKKNIRILKIRTGSFGELLAVFILEVIILCPAIMALL